MVYVQLPSQSGIQEKIEPKSLVSYTCNVMSRERIIQLVLNTTSGSFLMEVIFHISHL